MITPEYTGNKQHKVPITPKQAIIFTLIGLIGGIVLVVISNLFFYVSLKKACIWFAIGAFFVIAFPWACLKRETKNRSVRAHNCFVIFFVILFVVVMIVQWGTEHQPFPVWAIAILILGGCIAYSVMAYYAVQNFIKWCKGELENSNIGKS
jgi:drug/metabolite transporter (DMT)-like permease